MKKIQNLLLVLVSFSVGLYAEITQCWSFDDPKGTSLKTAAFSGTVSINPVNFTFQDAATDGSGCLVVENGKELGSANVPLNRGSPVKGGVISVQVRLSKWQITSAYKEDAREQLVFLFQDQDNKNIQLQLFRTAGNIALRSWMAGGSGAAGQITVPLSGTDPVVMVMELDTNKNIWRTGYDTGSGLSFSEWVKSPMKKPHLFILRKQGDWDDDYVHIDEITLTHKE
ncbi:MAG: hypothetical protein WC959_08275 [Kiritimatiellales bacterium]